MNPAADRWRRLLADWAIPTEILAAAPEFPYTMDPDLFRPRPTPEGVSVATERARYALQALPAAERSVLDVGCGGGAATMAVADLAVHATGVDESEDMLGLFAEEAEARGLPSTTVCGTWPEVEDAVGAAGVVVCHHVVYNVAELAPFVLALSRAARRRVVLELTPTHPQTSNAPLWEQFWHLDRPSGPSAEDALAVVVEAGIDATIEVGSAGSLRADASVPARAVTATRMLCLGPDRVPEVEEAIRRLPPRSTERAVIWWDVG
jgi:SAM-dependent methyltransferase